MKRLKKMVGFLLLLIMVVLLWGIYQYWSISTIGNSTEPQAADVIIVLGAAVWENGPSPSLKARIDYAQQLYSAGYAPKLILSGGQGMHGPTEARAMADALIATIAPEHLLLEEQSTNTYENLRNSKQIMEQYGYRSALIVTDAFHLKRALLIAEDIGLTAYGAPAKDSVLNRNKSLKMYYTAREVLALINYWIMY